MTITVKIRKTESKYLPGEYSAFLSFQYNADIIDEIRQFKDRAWNKSTKEWEITLKELSDFIYVFYDCTYDISGTYVDLSPKQAIVPTDFEFKTVPYQHQIDGFNYGLTHNKWLLADEMGLGKTKQVIDIAVAKKLECGYKHCLIICGVNGLKWNWVNEVHTHSNEDAYILGQRIKKSTGTLQISSNKEKAKDAYEISDNENYFIITNVESLRDENIRIALEEAIENGEINMIAADEVHKMKNPSSQQGKAFIKLNAEYEIALTGTPLMNSPLDLYIILRWLGIEKHAFYSFKQYYCIMGGYGGYEIIGYKHLNELEEQIDDIMLRRLKADVLDLPEKTYINEYVDMLPKQAQLYNEVKNEIIANIDLIKFSDNPLAEMIRLRQATGYTGILSSEIQCSAKLDRLVELVEDSLENGKQVIVFSNWTQITTEAMDRLYQYNPLQITGDTPDTLRQINVDDFQNGERQVIVGTFGAMGTGITLTAGSVVILLDDPWTMAAREQAVDRAYRIGTTDNITIYTLMCKGTIDEKVHEIIERKGAMSDIMIDKMNDMDKAELVDFLLS